MLNPSADTSLFETFPNNNLGAVQSLAAGTTGNGFRSRALLKFDFTAAGIPLGATINSVTLSLTVVIVPGGGGQNSVFDLHRVLQDWGEGSFAGIPTSTGGPAMAGEATWQARFHSGTLWTAPGAAAPTDFAAAASASQAVAGLGSYAFSGMTADAQTWLDNPAQNLGWILISQSEPTSLTARRFGSRENATARPTLLVNYSPVPEPATITLFGLCGLGAIWFSRRPRRDQRPQPARFD